MLNRDRGDRHGRKGNDSYIYMGRRGRREGGEVRFINISMRRGIFMSSCDGKGIPSYLPMGHPLLPEFSTFDM